jgi:hypothetical protein
VNPNVGLTFWITITLAMSVCYILVAIVRWRSASKRSKLALLLTIFGAVGFFELYPVLQFVPVSVEMPIIWSDVDIALDRGGNVYVASANGRVQKYDKSGQFLFGVMPDDEGGRFGVALTEVDELQIESFRARAVDYFSPEGIYLRRGKADQSALHSVLEFVTLATNGQFRAHFDPRQRVIIIEDKRTGVTTTTTHYSFFWLLVFNPIFWFAMLAAGLVLENIFRPKQNYAG